MKLMNALQSADSLTLATFLLSQGVFQDEYGVYIRSTDSDIDFGFCSMHHIMYKLKDITSIDKFFEKWRTPLEYPSGAIVLNIDNHREIPYVYETLKSDEYAKYTANCNTLEAIPIKKSDAVTYFRKFMHFVNSSCLPQEDIKWITQHSLDMNYEELLNASEFNTCDIFASFCCALSHQLWLLENQEI